MWIVIYSELYKIDAWGTGHAPDCWASFLNLRRINNVVLNMHSEARNLLDKRRKLNHGLGTLIWKSFYHSCYVLRSDSNTRYEQIYINIKLSCYENIASSSPKDAQSILLDYQMTRWKHPGNYISTIERIIRRQMLT